MNLNYLMESEDGPPRCLKAPDEPPGHRMELEGFFAHDDNTYAVYRLFRRGLPIYTNILVGFYSNEGIGGRMVPDYSSMAVLGHRSDYVMTASQSLAYLKQGVKSGKIDIHRKMYKITVEPYDDPITESTDQIYSPEGRFRISYRWDDANPANDVVHQIIIVHSEMDQNDRMWCVYEDDPDDPSNDVSNYYKIGYFDCMEGIGGRQTIDLSEFYTTDGEGDDFGPTLLYYKSLEEAIQHLPKGITILDWPRWQVERL